MHETLLRGARAVVTMDDARRVLQNADVHCRGPRIVAVGEGLEAPAGAEVIDCRGAIVIPGLINTHHHLYQTLSRAVPAVASSPLFDWLVKLYEVWRELDVEAARVGALVGLGELLLTGCTTTADHHYLFPRSQPDTILDETIAAAAAVGIRFHPTRGSMSRGRSLGGLPPDDVVQDEDHILRDCERVVERYHDPSELSMCRFSLAPCSPFSVTPTLMERVAVLARRLGVRLHTHVAETSDENDYCLKIYGQRPVAFMEQCGWLGPDVWYAHGIHFDDDEIALLGRTRTGVAHCPTSNLRLGSGICRVPALRAAGVPVGLAVDGSASNDCSSMLNEVKLALLVHRVGTGVDAMPPMTALELGTRGSAAVLGRGDIGLIAPDKAADIAIFDLGELGYAGTHDPLGALLMCGTSTRARTVLVNGKVVVRAGRLVGVDEAELARRAQTIAEGMLARASARTGIDYLAAR
ncbi:MAG: 8-oxoguanine deaminase [Deltaproteobacteria bacterium]|nr:8-oxoguanine deaminase [Deltaproteobacteria bacterium]